MTAAPTKTAPVQARRELIIRILNILNILNATVRSQFARRLVSPKRRTEGADAEADVLLFFIEGVYSDCALQYLALAAYCRAKHLPLAKDVMIERYPMSGWALPGHG
jgi:hypothetical protein